MKLTGSIFLLLLFLANTHLMSQALGSLIDTRDNKEYVTVDLLIKMEAGITKKRTWLGENLAYLSENASCYKDEPAFCEAFGRLYPWEDAITVCPEGWHLPSEKEWTEVIDSFGGRNSSGSALRTGGASNLNLSMGGFGNGIIYTGVGKTGSYWDAGGADNSGGAKVIPKTAGLISIDSNNDDMFHVQIGKEHLLSVRCMKNY